MFTGDEIGVMNAAEEARATIMANGEGGSLQMMRDAQSNGCHQHGRHRVRDEKADYCCEPEQSGQQQAGLCLTKQAQQALDP
jgi:hypothetical protein